MEFPDNCAEAPMHRYLLVLILAVAACLRFFSLDQVGLSATELSTLAFCSQNGLFAMMNNYASQTGMPPAYPSLLCMLTSWTSTADFFVRCLSPLAGIATVYVVYLIGKNFHSPINGLLAAVLVAVDFQDILVDRDTTAYSLFALFCMLNSYFFCNLVFDKHQTRRPIDVAISVSRFNISWGFDPGYNCNGHTLLGFWISGALAYYTNPVTLIFIAVELLAFRLLVEKSYRNEIWRFLWMPFLLLLLPWVPKLYSLSGWALHRNLFGIPTTNILQFKFDMLVPTNNWITQAKAICLGVSFLLILSQLRKNKRQQPQYKLCCLMALWILASALSVVLIKAIDVRSLMSTYCFLVIFTTYAVAYGIEKLPTAAIKNAVLLLIIMGAIVISATSNNRYRLYNQGGDAGFSLAAGIIAADQKFMRGNKTILTNSKIFGHYLDSQKITSSNITILDPTIAESIAPLFDNTDLYYLEYFNNDEKTERAYPTFDSLSHQYKILCMTNIPRFRITKFSRDTASTNDTVMDCQAYTKAAGAEL